MMKQTSQLLCLLVCLVLMQTKVESLQFGDAEVVHEWSAADFDWSSDAEREESTRNGSFVVERNLIAGIKVYKNDVYLTIPRWRFTSGIPATVVKVVQVQGQSKLRPYPDWASQTVGDCRALQYVQGMEIDPNTGRLYAIDIGRVGIMSDDTTPLNLCPPKIVVFDLNTDKQVASYDLPTNVVSRDNNFMNDLVLDYVDGHVRYAYITDPLEEQIHVFDFETKQAWNVKDQVSMATEENAEYFNINGMNYTFDVGIDGIAMSPNFDYVYYCSLAGYNLYQIPVSSLRNGHTRGIRSVGRKLGRSGGVVHGSNRFYYGDLNDNALYYWDAEKDVEDQRGNIGQVTMSTQNQMIQNEETMQWQDTFGVGDDGYLWFVTNRAQLFFADSLDFSGSDVNMRVWKVLINETSYFQGAPAKTARDNVGNRLGKTNILAGFMFFMTAFFLYFM